jgi:hypothetical protein
LVALDNEAWDKQMEEDAANGRLDFSKKRRKGQGNRVDVEISRRGRKLMAATIIPCPFDDNRLMRYL